MPTGPVTEGSRYYSKQLPLSQAEIVCLLDSRQLNPVNPAIPANHACHTIRARRPPPFGLAASLGVIYDDPKKGGTRFAF